MLVREGIVFIESSPSLGGSMICLRHLLEHYAAECHVTLISSVGSPFAELVPSSVDWLTVPNDLPAIKASRYLSLLLEIRVLWRYIKLFRKVRPKFVYLNNDTYSNRHAAAAAIFMGIPYLLHARGDIPKSRLSAIIVSRSQLNIAVSRYVKRQLDSLSQCSHKNIVIYDGVRIDSDPTMPELSNGATGGLRFLHVGNFVGWKGQRLLVGAFAAFLESST
ncbi:unnamed protein product, partial [Ectocarpus sp. 12 AP-2014]